jgi:predicted nuclease of predicted toxin-antitoxin system
VKILLDENLPQKLVAALRREGYEGESVHTLRLQGLDNGTVYEFARHRFDLCFTRDAGFRNLVREDRQPARLKLLRVTLQQRPQDEFVLDFISVFRASDWAQFNHGDDWP